MDFLSNRENFLQVHVTNFSRKKQYTFYFASFAKVSIQRTKFYMNVIHYYMQLKTGHNPTTYKTSMFLLGVIYFGEWKHKVVFWLNFDFSTKIDDDFLLMSKCWKHCIEAQR